VSYLEPVSGVAIIRICYEKNPINTIAINSKAINASWLKGKKTKTEKTVAVNTVIATQKYSHFWIFCVH
jgi:hypothetical protein